MSRKGLVEGVVIIVALLVFVAASFIASQQAGPDTQREELAKKLGLVAEKRRMFGRVSGCDIEVREESRGSSSYTIVTCRDAGLPEGLELEEVTHGIFRHRVTDFPVGDPRVDEHLAIGGRSAWVLAGASTEQLMELATAVEAGWKLSGQAWVHDGASAKPDEVEGLIGAGTRLAALVKRIATDVPERLLRYVRGGDNAARRLTAFSALNAELPRHAARDEALAAALRATDAPKLRLAAAKVARDEEVLAALMLERDDEVALAALATARENRWSGAVQAAMARLVARLSAWSPARLAAIAAALEHVPCEGAEAVLVRLLSENDITIKLAAMTSLAAIGTVEAVPALLPFREKVFGGELKGLAKEVIARIQARAGNPEAGRLRLSEGGQGELAVAAATAAEGDTAAAATAAEGDTVAAATAAEGDTVAAATAAEGDTAAAEEGEGR